MIPLDKIKLIIDYLKGKSTVSVIVLARAVYDVIGWLLNTVAPAEGTASAKFAVPAWLIPILFDLGKKLLEKLLAGKAEAKAGEPAIAGASAKAKKMEKWLEEVQGQAA